MLKPVWDTHTQWAQKGKLCSKKPLCSLLDISNVFQFNCTALTFDGVSVCTRQADFALTVRPYYLQEYKTVLRNKIHLTHDLCQLKPFPHSFLIPAHQWKLWSNTKKIKIYNLQDYSINIIDLPLLTAKRNTDFQNDCFLFSLIHILSNCEVANYPHAPLATRKQVCNSGWC